MTALAEKIASVTKTINAMRTVTAKKVTKSANVVINAIAKTIANVMKITNVMTIVLAKVVTAKRMKRDVIINITSMKRKTSQTT